MLLYHRCESLDEVVYGKIAADPYYIGAEHDEDYQKAYKWLAEKLGFWPLFLAAGSKLDDLAMTGYNNQWRIKIVDSAKKEQRKYRKKGEFPNRVMFSFEDMDGVFTDYDYWHYVLNAQYSSHILTDYEQRLVLKPSYTKARWLLKARKNPGSVQLVVPKLYLPDAKRVWVRNKKTKKLLEDMGFENVRVKRIPVDRW
jgi:hypothetical protein